MFWKILGITCTVILFGSFVAGYVSGPEGSDTSAVPAAQPNNGNMPKFNF